MFKTSLGVAEKEIKRLDGLVEEYKGQIDEQIRQNKILQSQNDWEVKKLKEQNEFELKKVLELKSIEIENAKNELRKEMQKDLITADLTRVEAVAKLSIYEKLDNKDQINQQTAMLKTAIEGLSRQIVTINQTGVK